MSVIWSGITEQGAVVPVQVDESGKVIARSDVAGDYVKKSGDTMTGPLVLPRDPAQPLEASTKQYVDSVITSTEPFAMGTFFWSYGVRKAINIASVRAKSDGIWEFYFQDFPKSGQYVVVSSSNSSGTQCKITSEEVLYFAIQGVKIANDAPTDQFGCNFVVWEAPGAPDVRISE
mgnify:CR=1 FL=1